MLEIDYIKNNYITLHKDALLELARNPKGLRPELVPVLIEILKERNIGTGNIEDILLETNYFLNEEREQLIRGIKNSECTNCNSSRNLNGYSFQTIISYIIYKNEVYESLIICNTCATKKNLNCFFKSLFLGWWSKGGLLSTPIALGSTICNLFIQKSISKNIINNFIDNNTLALRKFGTSEIALYKLIQQHNTSEIRE